MLLSKNDRKDNWTKHVNKAGYFLFVVAAAWSLLQGQDPSTGLTYLALAMVFDPFDPRRSWQERTLLQRIWLLMHLGLIILLLIITLTTG